MPINFTGRSSFTNLFRIVAEGIKTIRPVAYSLSSASSVTPAIETKATSAESHRIKQGADDGEILHEMMHLVQHIRRFMHPKPVKEKGY